MATETVINRPAPFVEEIGQKLSEQALGLQQVPVVTTGIGGITRQAGETDAGFKARQDAARAFTTRQQNLAGLRPEVAGLDPLQARAQALAQQGVGSFEPFIRRAETEAQLASGLGTTALGQLGAASATVGGVPLGAQAFQQDVSQFMSPYQQQVIDVSLAEFDRNKQMQEQQLRDQQAKLGVLGDQAASQRQQDIANRFNLGTAQSGIAGQLQGLGGFRSDLAQQQAQLGSAQQGLQGTDITRLGQLGSINQALEQARKDATREATRMAAFQPQEELNRFADITTGIMGGMRGTGTTTTNVPNPTPLQTALGVGSTLAGIYGAFNPRPLFG